METKYPGSRAELGEVSKKKDWEKLENKLGLSCAKLRAAWASYQLAFVLLAFTEGAYYA